MTFAQTVLAPAALGFVLGSIPFGVIASRLFYGRDLRSAGSGNIGAANALRTHGLAFGVLVLVLDALKGAAAVLLARALLGGEPAAAVAAAAAVLGHCYTPWLRFRGGKGVATLLGALAALTPLAGLVFALVWLLAVLPSRFSSLGSLLASVAAPFAVLASSRDRAAALGIALAALVVVWRHRDNIARLRTGQEPKIGLRRADQAARSAAANVRDPR